MVYQRWSPRQQIHESAEMIGLNGDAWPSASEKAVVDTKWLLRDA